MIRQCLFSNKLDIYEDDEDIFFTFKCNKDGSRTNFSISYEDYYLKGFVEKMNHIKTQCPAKINLFLRVLDKRIDGYHNIETSFQLIDLYDLISFEKITDEIIIESNEDYLGGEDNTIYASAIKVKEYLSDKKYGVKINIKKNIPTGSGMGGGSSNAASTIIALNKLWDLNLSKEY